MFGVNLGRLSGGAATATGTAKATSPGWSFDFSLPGGAPGFFAGREPVSVVAGGT
jgi:hypothetical protein